MAKDSYIVTTGPKAYSFHDQSTGITICRGEEIQLSRRQYLSSKIQKAIAAGHIILVQDKAVIQKYSDSDIEKMDKKLANQIKKGMTVEKMAKAYSLEEMKLIAAEHEIEADETDTVESLIQAVVEELEASKE